MLQMILTLLIVAVAGYFFGNISSALIISKVAFDDDVRRYGSGNAGSTNMIRVYGRKYGFLTLFGDALKATLAYLLGYLVGMLFAFPAPDGISCAKLCACVAGVFAVFGHCYPVLYKFKGGKGAASCLALSWCFCWQAAIAVTIAVVLIFLAVRRVSVVSILCAVLYILCSAIAATLGWTQWYVFWIGLVPTILVLLRHIPNMKRLLRGEEPKLHLIHGTPLKDANQTKKEESHGDA